MNRILHRSSLLALVAMLAACADSGPGDNNHITGYQSDCEPSNASGLYLTALGGFSQDVAPGTTVQLKAMVIHLDDGSETQGGVVPGATVSFQLISVLGDGQLSTASAITDGNGVATVDFVANEAAEYQINASVEGTCTVTFSVGVVDQLRSLRIVGANPRITLTSRRINLSVQAFSPVPGQGEYPIVGDTVTFALGSGGSGTTLTDVGGQNTGATLGAVTGPQGIATVQLETGTQAVPGGVDVTATLAGTAPVIINVIIQDLGTGPCTSNADCTGAAPICDGGTCVPVPQSGPCASNDDCVAPYVCHVPSGTCLAPNTNGDPCSPVAANPCPQGQACIAGYCTDIPTDQPCTNNDDCPTGWLCVNGTCQPDIPPGQTGCVETGDCQSGFVCVGGTCIPETNCTNPQPPTRLGGTWSFDSTLHLRQALSGFVSTILGAFEFLRDVIEGNLDIPGVPGFVEDFIEGIIQSVIQAYVPPWAQQLIIALGNISDIIDDMRVYSTVSLVSLGNYEYIGNQTWDIVEFEYRGTTISEDPANIPEIGYVPMQSFSSREVCGIFFIDRFEVNNVVGGLIRWAVEATLTAITCSVPGWGCYYSIEDAMEDLIDCDSIAYELDDLAYNTFGIEVYDAVYNLCENGKQQAIDALINWLDNIEVSLNLMSMRGQADIATSSFMNNGRWYGTLVGGSYDGEFSATKQ